MFNKLLSNLPFNPSLIEHVSFYARRLQAEASVRRLGFIFASLALVIQLFAFMSPPQPTLARSGNDIIEGGIGSVNDAVFHCQSNTGGFGTILNHFGVSCDNVAAAGVTTLNSRAYDSQLFSMGRLAYGKAGETPVGIAGTTFWLRYLWSWDGFASSNYTALQVTGRAGNTMFILFDCGNPVFVGLPSPPPAPTPPPPPPPQGSPGKPQISQQCVAGTLKVMVSWSPTPGGPPAGGYWIDVNPGSGSFPANSNQYPHKWVGNTTSTTLPQGLAPPPNFTFTSGTRYFVRIGDGAKHSPVHYFDAKSCVTPTPPPPVVPPPPAPCPQDPSILKADERCKPCTYNTAIIADSPACRPCEQSQSSEDKTACLEFSKAASNDTTGVADAHGTKAKGGDVITYVLRVKNNGKANIDNFIVQENISDVLDYSVIVNLNGAEKDDNHIIGWPATTIRGGETIERKFTVKVKSPIPQTPASASDPGHFDLEMTNVYGNAITIKLPQTPVKRAEALSGTLPNTGPGTGLIAGFSLLVFIGYFYARSRIAAHELNIIKSDYSSGVGV